jgi:hypothetical protein
LAVTANGGKSWHFRYYWLKERKRMSLGTYPEVSLLEARALRDEARALVAKGINPHVYRKQKRCATKLAAENIFRAYAVAMPTEKMFGLHSANITQQRITAETPVTQRSGHNVERDRSLAFNCQVQFG